MDHAVVLELMRHAKTPGNVARRYVGWTDETILEMPLPVIDARAKHVICSDLTRTIETAAHYFPQATPQCIAAFRESHFGYFEMKTYEQLKDCPVYRAWLDAPESVAPPHGETLTTLYKRVRMAMTQLTSKPHQYAVLHGGTIRAILVQFAPQPSAFWDWQVGHETRFVLTWHSHQAFEEGQRCTSLSVVPLTASEHTSNN